MTEIDDAVEVLKKGGVIIYPTETVYGLGAGIFNKKAVERIKELKGREFDKPLSIAMRLEDVNEYAYAPDITLYDIFAHLPGPITIVVRKKKVPEWITRNEYVGIRVPEDPVAFGIISEFGPIVSTSANKAGESAPCSVDEIPDSIKEGVDLVIDTGETKYKGPSTVVKVNDKVEILREGVLNTP